MPSESRSRSIGCYSTCKVNLYTRTLVLLLLNAASCMSMGAGVGLGRPPKAQRQPPAATRVPRERFNSLKSENKPHYPSYRSQSGICNSGNTKDEGYCNTPEGLKQHYGDSKRMTKIMAANSDDIKTPAIENLSQRHEDDLVRFKSVKSGGTRLLVVYFLLGQGWTVEDESEGRLWATLKSKDSGDILGNMLIEVFSEGQSGDAGALRVRRLADRNRPYMLKEAVALKALLEQMKELNEDTSIPHDKRLFFLETDDELSKAVELVLASVK